MMSDPMRPSSFSASSTRLPRLQLLKLALSHTKKKDGEHSNLLQKKNVQPGHSVAVAAVEEEEKNTWKELTLPRR